ncbi:cyclin-like protein [Suillus spraguei]|nr:cyclin-like protein [Suillus spraguei]
MSSNLPTRRVTRVTRTAVQKDSENANARPSRIISRVKPPSTSVIPAPTATLQSRALGATAASRAKVGANDENKVDLSLQGKRKREALGEVTTKNINKNKDGKGKGKEVAPPTKETFDGVVIKAKPAISLRQITAPARRTTRSAIVPEVKPLKDVKEGLIVNDEDAMAVDDHPPAPETSRRVSTRRSGANTQQVITQEVQRVQTTRRTSSHLVFKAATQEEVQDDRVFKKRRTSSDAPETDIDEQAQHEAEVAAVLDDNVAPEADPDGDEWDDLDAEDSDDPLMVSEYVVEIFKYMKLTELITLPNPEYMASQKELAWSMRGILLDWLVQVHARFRLLPETLFLCVNIIDRFLSARVVSLAKLQLVGITIVAPSVSHFLHCADSSYTESEILLAERYVLKTIDWNLSYPNPMHFLRRISKADDYDVKSRTMGKYLLEVGTLEWRLLATPPSLVAAAATWLGRLILGNDKWTPNHAHYSSYAESSIIPTANLMLNYILKPVRHESFYKKYAGKRFMKVSVLVREWALERWEEGEQVSLLAELQPSVQGIGQKGSG